MRLLLFLISALFSYIFYVFYNLSKWKDLFWHWVLSSTKIESFSWNLLLETVIFFTIWVFFVLYFSPKSDKKSISLNENIKTLYIFFYIILLSMYFLWIFKIDFFVFSTIVFFIFWDVSFNILSNLNYFDRQKIWLRYFWLTINYITIFISLYYIFNIHPSIFLIVILVFSAFFNYFVHKKYTNYISLSMSILIFIFLLFFSVLQIYSVIEKILFK